MGIKKKFGVFYLCICLFSIGYSNKVLSKKSQLLIKLKQEAIETKNREKELEYLKVFPNTFNSFRFIFDNINFDTLELNELTDCCTSHLIFFDELSKKYPNKVLDKLLNISTGGEWHADATGILQNQIADFASKKTKLFVEELRKRPLKVQLSIIKFIADVENFYYYKKYDVILKNLLNLNQNKLYKFFIEAREERKKHRHD